MGFLVSNKTAVLLFLLLLLLFLIPFRYLLIEGDVFFTNEGYKHSWRVMSVVMTNAQLGFFDERGKQYKVHDIVYQLSRKFGRPGCIPSDAYRVASYLCTRISRKRPFVSVEAICIMNGKNKDLALIIKPDVNLCEVEYSDFSHNSWVYPNWSVGRAAYLQKKKSGQLKLK